MNKQEYLRCLARELRHLPREDRQRVLEYYEEYFEEAGPEQEQSVIEELGPPSEVAGQIIQDTAIKRMEEPGESAKKGFSTVWIIILALFAAPIGLPLALALVVVLLALVFTVVIFAGAIVFSGFCLVVCGILGIVAGIWILFSEFANGLCITGMGLLCGGTGILFLYGSYYVVKWIGRGTFRMFRKILMGGKKHEKV